MTKAAKSHSRRPVNYWSKFNEWWRLVLEESGRRPEAAAINRWYEENAHEIWSPNDMPTMLETRIHAKCLRSVDEVRNYFRAYRAQRRADAAAKMESGYCGDPLSEDADTEGPAPRAVGRRTSAGAGARTHSSAVTTAANAAVQPTRGGVSKVVSSSTRQARPASQSSTVPGVFQHSSYSFGDRVAMDATAAAGSGIGLDGGVVRSWLPHGQVQIAHRQPVSTGNGAVVAGTSVVITGYPHADHRFRALSNTQPVSPAKAHPSAANRQDPTYPPSLAAANMGLPELTYGSLDRPCSSVSTASLDALLGMQDEDPRDDAAFTAQQPQQQPLLHYAPSNAVTLACQQQQHQLHHLPHGGPGSSLMPQAQQQLQKQPHILHPQPPAAVQPQQQLLQVHQQPSQQQHQPGLMMASDAAAADLRSIFDDCPDPGNHMVHAELTLLQPHGKQQQHHMPQHLQQQQQQLRFQQEEEEQLQHRLQQAQDKLRQGVHGCAEMSLSAAYLEPCLQQQHIAKAQACQNTANVVQQANQQASRNLSHEEQHQPQQLPGALASEWTSHQDTEMGCLQQHCGTAAGSVGSQAPWGAAHSQVPAVSTPATPMDVVGASPCDPAQPQLQSQPSIGADFSSWLPTMDAVKQGPSSNIGECGGVDGMTSIYAGRQLQEMPSAGPSPDAPSSLSNITPAPPRQLEAIEPPQPLSGGTWSGDPFTAQAKSGPAAAPAGAEPAAAAPSSCGGVAHQGSQPLSSQLPPAWLGSLAADAAVTPANCGNFHVLARLHGSGSAPVLNVATALNRDAAAAAAYNRQVQQLAAAGRLGALTRAEQPRVASSLPPLPPFTSRQLSCDKQPQNAQRTSPSTLPSGGSLSAVISIDCAHTWGSQAAALPQPTRSQSFTPPGAHSMSLLPDVQKLQQHAQQQQHAEQHTLKLQQHAQQLQRAQLQLQLQQQQQLQLQQQHQQSQVQAQQALSRPVTQTSPGMHLSAPLMGRAATAASFSEAAGLSFRNPVWSTGLASGAPSGLTLTSRSFEGSGQQLLAQQHSVVHNLATARPSAPLPTASSFPALGESSNAAAFSSGPSQSLLGGAATREVPARQLTSPGVVRRHSQPCGGAHTCLASMLQQQQQQQQQHLQQQQPRNIGCAASNLLQLWQRNDFPEGQTDSLLRELLGPPQQQQHEGPVVTLAQVAARDALIPRVKEEIAGGASVGAARINCGDPLNCVAPLAAPCAVAVAVPHRPPTLMRTLSAPPGDGTTPRSSAAAIAAAVATSASLTNASTALFPCGPGGGGSGGMTAQVQPGHTPVPEAAAAQQHQQAHGQASQAAAGGTPGSGAGFGSPGGCWGDRALAELEGDSMWLSNMLSSELAPAMSYF